jgi:mannose-1-phosphate guanylyltransferase
VLAFAELARHTDGPVAVFPADHFIGNPEHLAELLGSRSVSAASEHAILLVGVTPTRPEVGYGYIEVQERAAEGVLQPVVRFHEKPPLDVATRYVMGGRHLWNAGMLIARPEVFLAEVRRHAPRYLDALRGEEAYRALPRLSVDHGLLEKSKRLSVLPSALSWDDVGSWESLPRLLPSDEGGNVSVGPVTAVDVERSLIVAGARPVVAFGVQDLLLVDDGDVLFVAERGRAAEMKRLLAALEAQGAAAVAGGLGAHVVAPKADTVVEKPWGREYWWAGTDRYAAKLLVVLAGHSLSLQYHERKEETLWFLEGRALLTTGERVAAVGPGEVAHIPPGTVHRITALSDLAVVEVSTPELSDVVRIEDRYGRTSNPA